jgi:EamA domain-containing membrane protein RarD
VVLAQLILREHVTAAQRVGVAFAFAGVGLVTVG